MIKEEVKKRVETELKKIKPSFELDYVCHLNDIKAEEYLYTNMCSLYQIKIKS